MAGWSDINIPEGQELGALESGYILDIDLINTYIKAHNEKTNIVNGSSIEEIITEVDIPEEDQEEPTEENPNPPTTELAGPYIWNFDKLSQLLRGYGQLMNNITWVREEVFLDPLSIDSVYLTDAGRFTEEDIILLIGQNNFDILSDPFDNWDLIELQSVSVFNAMYKLYSEVFIYVERDSIPSFRWRLRYHQLKIGDSVTSVISDNIPKTTLGLNEFFKVEDFLNIEFKNEYDNVVFAPKLDNNFRTKFSISDVQNGKINTGDANDFSGTNDQYSSNASAIQQVFNSVTHNFINHEGDFVILEFSATGEVLSNYIKDSTLPTSGDLTTVTQFDNDFPLVSLGGNPFRIKWPDLVTSQIIEETGWVFTTVFENHHDYNIKTTDFIYDFGQIPPKDNPNDTRKALVKNCSIKLSSGDADNYYNTNVEGMIYNTLPEEEEEI